MKSVLVCVANGSEDIETVCPIDILRRAGANVTVAKVLKPDETPTEIATLTNKVKIICDTILSPDVAKIPFDLIVVPGGLEGSNTMKDNAQLITLLKSQLAAKKFIGSICAAPSLVLGTNGILKGIPATCYPNVGFEKNFDVHTKLAEKVVMTDYIVTSQGPGTALLFAKALVEKLFGKEKADEVCSKALIC